MSSSTRSSSRSQSRNNYSYPAAYNTSTDPGNMSSKNTTRTRSTSRSPARTVTSTNGIPQQTNNKLPSFSTTALSIPIPVPSPPPSSESNSASSLLETRYLNRTRLLNRLRLLLSLPLFLSGIAIIALEGVALKFYNYTNLPASFHLPLWPEDVDLGPAVISLVAGSVVTLGCLFYTILAIIPSPRPKTRFLSPLFSLTTSLSLLASTAALIYTSYTAYHPPTSPGNPTASPGSAAHTIQSWTCYLSNSASRFNADMALLQIPTSTYPQGLIAAPMGFERTCKETHAGWGLLIAVVAMEVGAVGLVAAGWWVERGIGRERGRVLRDAEVRGQVGEKGFVSRMSW